MGAVLDLQVASQSSSIPDAASIQLWLDKVYSAQGLKQQEITIRIVDESESQQLNLAYRGKDTPTNVLSFPFEAPVGIEVDLLGDLVVCAPVVEREAQQQNKPILHHWAHMIVHGTLHLLGHDHIKDEEAVQMESLEVELLSQLSIDDPYQDH